MATTTSEPTAFCRLIKGGYRLRTDGETLWVSPSAGMSEGMRADIAEHKRELIAQTLWWGIWRELEARKRRLPERTDGEEWTALLRAYELLSLALGPDVTAQLEQLSLVPA